jgi:hypothetical protein
VRPAARVEVCKRVDGLPLRRQVLARLFQLQFEFRNAVAESGAFDRQGTRGFLLAGERAAHVGELPLDVGRVHLDFFPPARG